MTSRTSFLTVTFISLFAVAFAAFWEVGVAVCASALIFALYGLFWTLILLPLLLRKASVSKYGIYALLVVSLVALYVVPWNSRKSFLRDFSEIRIGMTVSEVELIMGNSIRGTGWPTLPSSVSSTQTPMESGLDPTIQTVNQPHGDLEIQDSIVYRHSNEGAFNSDWGVVQFKDGKVTNKVFLPD